MNMQHEYGIIADERQQLDHLRAASKAFRVMVWIGVIGYPVVLIVTRDESIALVLAAIAVIGMIVHERYLEKTGWEEYVAGQIASNPSVRRRALRSIPLRALYGATVAFIDDYFVQGHSALRAGMKGLAFAVVLGFVFWFLGVRRKKLKIKN